MATVLRRAYYDVSWTNTYWLTPIGDIHLGAAACDEEKLSQVIKKIAENENHYWIGMGDYCDWINTKDPRYSVDTLADWVTRHDLVDLAKAQMNRLKGYLKPISNKCLGLICGNHEESIMRHSERDVYSELVAFIKDEGGFPMDHKLGLGFYGWLKLSYYNSPLNVKDSVHSVTINAHHGFTGGKLAGAKALDMQRWLWTHDADLVVFGHVHSAPMQPEAVEALDRNDNIILTVRKGCYSGTFLRNSNPNGSNTYSEIKGYFPSAIGTIPEIEIRPGEEQAKRIRVII